MTSPSGIVYLVNALEFDAPTRVMAQVASAQRAKGIPIAFAAWQRGASEKAQWNSAMGLEGIALADSSRSRPASFIKLYAQARPAIVHTTLLRPSLAFFWLLCRNKFRCSWVITHHGVHEWKEKAGGFLGFILSRIVPYVYNQANAIITPSSGAKDDLVNAGVNPDIITVIPNGVLKDGLPCAPADSHLHKSHDYDNPESGEPGPLIISAGNLRPVKGYDVLLKAMPVILQAFPSARVMIWGEGPERSNLEKLIRQLNLQDNVCLSGSRSLWWQGINERAIYVQPSRSESFGMAAAEAMAAGIPVVVSDAGGLPELVDQGRAGLIFARENPIELAAAVIRLLRDPILRKQLGDTSRQRISDEYSANIMISRYSELYASLGVHYHE